MGVALKNIIASALFVAILTFIVQAQAQPLQWLTDCGGPVTLISTIQGASDISPLRDQTISVEGIVTARFDHAGSYNGFTIQSLPNRRDNNPNSSEGLFIYLGKNKPYYEINDLLRISGKVREHKGRTELTQIQHLVRCQQQHASIPPTIIHQSMSPIHWESFEGMLVQFATPLTIISTHQLQRFGSMTVSTNGRIFQPTQQQTSPLSEHSISLPIIELDDGLIQVRPDKPLRYLSIDNQTITSPIPPTLLRGDALTHVTAIVDYSFNQYRLLPTQPYHLQPQQRTTPPNPSPYHLRIATLNLNNYFNGYIKKFKKNHTPFKQQRQFVSRRGPKSESEFIKKKKLIVDTLLAMKADIYAISEIENDGYHPNSSLADLAHALTSQSNVPYHFSQHHSQALGSDEIRVALLYNANTVQPIAQAKTTQLDALGKGNRAPLLQSFQINAKQSQPSQHPKEQKQNTPKKHPEKHYEVASPEIFHIVVNHFKSKSGCPKKNKMMKKSVETPTPIDKNRDQGDGEACWSASRRAAAKQLVTWLNSTGLSPQKDHILLVGDFNAHYFESPLQILYQSGYTNALPHTLAPTSYTYNYKQFSGQLDHILLSQHMIQNTQSSDQKHTFNIWHTFSDQHQNLKHQSRAQSQRIFLDHDPIYIDLFFKNLKRLDL